MTDERDPSGRALPHGDELGEGGMRDANPRDQNGQNGRDPYARQGLSDQDPGMHRGPRRSRYGRRRTPQDGQGEFGGGYQQNNQPRGGDPMGDDVESYLPSFIAGPSNGGGSEHHQPNPQRHESAPAPSHQPYSQPVHQSHQPHPQQHGGHQGPGGGHNQGGHPQQHQPMHQMEHQGGYQQGGHHQPSPPPVPEEPSPEVQAAAAAFAEWEDSNPKLRGLLVCSPTVKRGEPIVRGTRIPARILAAIAKMGSSIEEMLQDYPALTREGLEAALAFADANPRKPA
jgi:uncharacterized protein (DUF433 family)